MTIEEFDFIYFFYIILMSILGLMVVLSLLYSNDRKFPFKPITQIISVSLISFTIVYIGTRDIAVGVDTNTYTYIYDQMLMANSFEFTRDLLWDFLMYSFSRVFDNVAVFFSFVAFIYLVAPYYAMRRLFGFLAIYSLLLFFIVPNFFMAGINGIRSGIAASLFLFALGFDRDKKKYLWMFIACLFHLSMLLPFCAFIVSKYVKKINFSLMIWLVTLISFLSIGFSILSLPLGGLFGERLSYYLQFTVSSSEAGGTLTNFIVYSISPILTGVYFIFLKKYKDELYIRLLNTYIICNIVYILVMNMYFADRFAYLSEFLLPFVLVYPLLKERFWRLQLPILSCILLIIFSIKAYKILAA